ncbi:Uncharacterised protein [Buttiauxella agrestis]|uniref:Uncharacterized protein n=1 Tax=Buttiauxella agrestis TaxID=82977 RepID=A0A381CAJ3_9ENTR|nr:Uncharacterised protein [Buttiauxella agrestis]
MHYTLVKLKISSAFPLFDSFQLMATVFTDVESTSEVTAV